ncbi:Cpr49Af, partial [Drosophila busckii]
MKLLLVCAVLVTVAYAVDDGNLISSDAVVRHDGKFVYHYELHDGTKVQQRGVHKQITPQNGGEAIEGHYEYVGDDGQTYSVSYVADENGFHPVGAHLPTPPPVPESVIRTLKYIEEHPY